MTSVYVGGTPISVKEENPKPFYGFGDDLAYLFGEGTQQGTGGILDGLANPVRAGDRSMGQGTLTPINQGYSGQLMPTQTAAPVRNDIMYGASPMGGYNPFFANGLTQGQAAAQANATANTTTTATTTPVAQTYGFTGINPFVERGLNEAEFKARSVGMAQGGIASLVGNNIYPQSRMDQTQYAINTQLPTSSEVIGSDYDAKTDAYNGMPYRFAQGGIADIRFEKGGLNKGVDEKALERDPNKFADNVRQLYKNILNRDVGETDLINAVDMLNKNPDDFGWLARHVAESEEAQKLYGGKTAEDGAPIEYDPEALAMAEMSGYGKWKPQPKQGGIGGFYNNNPLVALPLTAAMIMAPEIIPALMETGAGAVPLAEITGSSFAGPAFALPEGLAATTVGAPSLDPVLGITSIAPEAAAYPGMSAELAAELGLAGSNSGLSTTGASGDVLANMGIEAAEKGITAKQAFAAKMALDSVNSLANQGQVPGGQGPSSTTTQIIFNPNAGKASTPGIAPIGGGPQFGQLYDTKANTYNYFPRGYAQGGIANLAGGGSASLGSYSDGGHLLKGPGDGMSDHIPATIGGKQPARLADGEFVIPADVVSHLGNGSTDAGAKQLYKMMDKIRKARTGRKQQGKQINPNKYLLKG